MATEFDSSIVVRLQVPGFHQWKDAPAECAWLRTRHRHVFWFECVKLVAHDDRDTEFILLKTKIDNWLYETYQVHEGSQGLEFGERSCEMIAREVAIEFGFDEVTVYEDGENGGRVRRRQIWERK